MAPLTKQQEYLLGRLPKKYDLRKLPTTEPTEVKQARKVLAAFDDKRIERENDRQKRFNKMTTQAREAIYFKAPEKALEIVKALETEFSKELP